MKNSLKPYNRSFIDPRDTVVDSLVLLKENFVYVSFSVSGNLEAYQIPTKQKQKRDNNLWESTCFELFLANSEMDGYYELNLSPSLAWNLYYLSDYRATPKEVCIKNEIEIETFHNEDSLKLSCKFEMKTDVFNLYNVAVILLTQSNQRHFWSVHHRSEEADFHDKDNFMKI